MRCQKRGKGEGTLSQRASLFGELSCVSEEGSKRVVGKSVANNRLLVAEVISALDNEFVHLVFVGSTAVAELATALELLTSRLIGRGDAGDVEGILVGEKTIVASLEVIGLRGCLRDPAKLSWSNAAAHVSVGCEIDTRANVGR